MDNSIILIWVKVIKIFRTEGLSEITFISIITTDSALRKALTGTLRTTLKITKKLGSRTLDNVVWILMLSKYTKTTTGMNSLSKTVGQRVGKESTRKERRGRKPLSQLRISLSSL